MIGKLLDLKPSLILVEKSVAHLAQEILLREGVSLAVNVKRKVLTRLSRLTQVKILDVIDNNYTIWFREIRQFKDPLFWGRVILWLLSK